MTTQEIINKECITEDPAQRIFNLFEGACPDCGKEVKVKEWSGTRSFLQDHPSPDNAVSNVWRDRDEGYGSYGGGHEIGCVIFVCVDGHEHYVGYGVHGDWMC